MNKTLAISKEIKSLKTANRMAKETARMHDFTHVLRYKKSDIYDIDFRMLFHATNWYYRLMKI